MNTIEGDLNAAGMRLAIVAARFNEFVVDKLIEGAERAVRQHGGAADSIDVVRVPGAFEMPVVLEKLASSGQFDGLIALGAVIRGSTPHFDYVAGECASAVAQISRSHGLPIGFGVLTVDTIEQAIERSGTKAGNKGEEAALSVIETVSLLRQLG